MNKREDILLTTIRLYHEKGDSVSLDAVAKEAGCSKTLIIHYYGNRSNLLSSCFGLVCREVRCAFNNVEAPETHDRDSLKQHLTELWRAYFDYLKNNPLKARFFIQYSHSHEPLPPRYMTPEKVILRILNEGYSDLMRDDPHLSFDIKCMVAIAHGMAAFVFSNDTEPTDELTERCIFVMMNGVMASDRDAPDSTADPSEARNRAVPLKKAVLTFRLCNGWKGHG